MTGPRSAEGPTGGSRRQRILLVHRYFWPDTPPYAAMLREIGRTLVLAGHDVEVLTCQPSYRRAIVSRAPRREELDGVKIVRWGVLDDRRSTWRKVANLVMFSGRLVASRRRFRRADVVMAATTPPVLVALVCSVLARASGARFVYHKQDVWPEVADDGPGLKRALSGILRRIDHGTDRRAARVVVLSEDMARTVSRRGRLAAAPVVLNNFDPWELDAIEVERRESEGLDLVFAGNLGRFQGLDVVAELVQVLSDEPLIRWHILGDGPNAERFQELADHGAPVTMYGHCAPATVADVISRIADLGLVSLSPGVIDAAYPSKTMTYLRHGCPVLALVEQYSELATMIRRKNIGVTGDPADLGAVAARLRDLARDPEEIRHARQRARHTYEERFSAERQLSAWRDLVDDLVARR